jgi:hypothetical protein
MNAYILNLNYLLNLKEIVNFTWKTFLDSKVRIDRKKRKEDFQEERAHKQKY